MFASGGEACCLGIFGHLIRFYAFWMGCYSIFSFHLRRQRSTVETKGVGVEKAIQVFVAVNFLVIGLSHLIQRSAWLEYFAKLHSLGRLGPFAEGFLYLNFGALIVSFHNVWTIPEVVLTLIGWVQVLKALVRFIAPEAVLRMYEKMGQERAWQIQLAGGFLLALSAFFLFLAFQKTIS